MNRALAVVLALAALLAVALAAPADEKYTSKYDNINIDEILNNDRLRDKYVDCVLQESDARCTPEGKELKNNMSEALINDCSKCTDKQKEWSSKVIKFLKEKKPEDFEKLRAKYDPEDVYLKKFAEKSS